MKDKKKAIIIKRDTALQALRALDRLAENTLHEDKAVTKAREDLRLKLSS